MIHSIRNVRRRRGVTLGAVVMLAAGVLASAAFTAHAADKGPQISRSIAKQMIAAQKALQASQWNEAIKNLDAADEVSGLTPFDHKTIDDFKGFAYARLGNLKASQAAYEAALATGQYSPEDEARTIHILFGLSANAQNYPKTIEFGKRMADLGTANGEDLAIVGQSYYLSKDCKNAVVWEDKSIALNRKAGQAPKEGTYQIKLRCAFEANDNPGTMAALEDLIRLTGKTEYWNNLLRLERQDQKDDHNLLMVIRLMYATNSMTTGSDYMEMAQLLGDAALPGEAEAVLDKANSVNAIPPEQKERTTRLVAATKARADADKKGLPQFATEAAKSPSGELDVKLGEVYYGFGDFPNAVKAIQEGLQKGQVKHMDEAYVYLGLAQAQLKNYADARKAFQNLKTVQGVPPAVARSWDLYGERLGQG
jgi:tetratricopeptide (TPR) repeat protein